MDNQTESQVGLEETTEDSLTQALNDIFPESFGDKNESNNEQVEQEENPDNLTPEAPEQETETPVEEAPEQEETEEKTQEEKSDADPLPKGVQKRIDTYKVRQEQLKEKLDAKDQEIRDLQQRLESPKKESSTVPADPILAAKTLDDLNELNDKATKLEDWCIENNDGEDKTLNEKDANGDYIVITAKEIRQQLISALQMQRKIPQRMNDLVNQERLTQEAVKFYPWLNDPQSAEYQELNAAIKLIPGLEQLPNHKMIIGDALAGQAMRLGKQSSSVRQPSKSVEPKKQLNQVKKPVPTLPSKSFTATPKVPTESKTSNRETTLDDIRNSSLRDLFF